jgi:hypothetical protein
VEYEEEGCFHVKEFELIEEATEFGDLCEPEKFKDNGPTIGISKPTNVPEIVTENGVHICNIEPELAQQIQALVIEFTVCWEEKGPIAMTQEEMMSVPLVDGWQNGKISAKVYPIGIKDSSHRHSY